LGSEQIKVTLMNLYILLTKIIFNNKKLGKNKNYGIWMNIDGTITGGLESQSDENLNMSQKYIDAKW
jgi:hypothetical protein